MAIYSCKLLLPFVSCLDDMERLTKRIHRLPGMSPGTESALQTETENRLPESLASIQRRRPEYQNAENRDPSLR